MRPAHQAREVTVKIFDGCLFRGASMRPAHQAREVIDIEDHSAAYPGASMRPAHQAREVTVDGEGLADAAAGFNEARASSAGSNASSRMRIKRSLRLQ